MKKCDRRTDAGQKVIPKCLLCQRQAQQQDSKIDTEFVINNWMYGYGS